MRKYFSQFRILFTSFGAGALGGATYYSLQPKIKPVVINKLHNWLPPREDSNWTAIVGRKYDDIRINNIDDLNCLHRYGTNTEDGELMLLYLIKTRLAEIKKVLDEEWKNLETEYNTLQDRIKKKEFPKDTWMDFIDSDPIIINGTRYSRTWSANCAATQSFQRKQLELFNKWFHVSEELMSFVPPLRMVEIFLEIDRFEKILYNERLLRTYVLHHSLYKCYSSSVLNQLIQIGDDDLAVTYLEKMRGVKFDNDKFMRMSLRKNMIKTTNWLANH